MEGPNYAIVEQLLLAVLELRQDLRRLTELIAASTGTKNGSINGKPLPKRTFMWSSEAAEVIGCEPRTIREWIRDGKIESARREDENGGRWQIAVDEVYELASSYQPRGPRRRKPEPLSPVNGHQSAV
jgi:excisionase family DNA binding protein